MPEAVDDATISGEERLYHRVRLDDIVQDSTNNEPRPSSSTFRSTENIVSVDIASLTTPEAAIAANPSGRLIEIDVAFLRSIKCKIVRDPLPENPAHALIYGSAPGGRLTKSQARAIVKKASWVRVAVDQAPNTSE